MGSRHELPANPIGVMDVSVSTMLFRHDKIEAAHGTW